MSASIRVLAIRLIGAGAAFGMQIVTAKLLIPEEFGVFSTYLAIATLGSLLAKLGFDVAAVRFIPPMRRDGRPDQVRAFVAYASRTVILLIAVSCVAWVGGVALSGSDLRVHVVSAALLASLALLRLGEGILRAFEMHRVASSGITTALPLLSLAGMALVQVVTGSLDAVIALVVIVACQVAVLSVFAVAIMREVRFGPSSYDRSQRSQWFQSAAHLTLYAAAVIVVGQSDVLIVAAVFGTERAGAYALAWKIASVLTLPLMALNFVVGPRIAASAHPEQVAPALMHRLRSAVRLLTALSAGAGVVLIIAGSELLGFFDNTYRTMAGPFALLVLTQVINTAGGPVVTALNVIGEERAVSRVLFAAAVFNLLMSATLAPLLGPTGVAAGTLVTTIVWIVALGRRMGRLDGTGSFPFLKRATTSSPTIDKAGSP